MSALEQVSKLETLLARIQSRAGAPRSVAAPEAFAARSASVAPSLPPEPPRVASIPPEPPPRVASIPPEAILAGQLQTTPPPMMGSEPPPTQAEVDAMVLDGEMDVEVSTEMVEVDIDEDDALIDEGYPRESAVLVADQGRAPVEETLDEEPVAESLPPDAPPANEVIEPAPSSSPRAIDSYETTPRHTPPPESGKQVAAASVKPDPRMSSSPPPSDGHTLMGGWREPGMPLRGGEARPGVRVPPPPPPPPAELFHSAPPPPPPGSATPSIAAKPMTSDTTVPAFPPFTEIGIVESPASSFAPATFGDLLDASLSL